MLSCGPCLAAGNLCELVPLLKQSLLLRWGDARIQSLHFVYMPGQDMQEKNMLLK